MQRRPKLAALAPWATKLAFGLAFTGCGWRDAPVPPTEKRGADRVELSAAPPPAGAVALGTIDVTHGEGCGVFGQDGTRAGIDHALRAEAVRKRANFVHVVELEEPHMQRNCFDHVFRAHALAYRVNDRPLPERSCEPPCSPGYACQNGACAPLCNPACAPGAICRMDRTCGPVASEAQP